MIEGLEYYYECASHYEHARHCLLESGGEFCASSQNPHIAGKDNQTCEESEFLYDYGEDVVGECKRQTCVFARLAYAYAPETTVCLGYVAELFLLMLYRERLELLVWTEMVQKTVAPHISSAVGTSFGERFLIEFEYTFLLRGKLYIVLHGGFESDSDNTHYGADGEHYAKFF